MARVEVRGNPLLELLGQRIVILDGGMGTMLQKRCFTEGDFRGRRFADWRSDLRGNSDLLSLTQPEAVSEVHRAYLQAGADVICTNTFNSTRISQADYGTEVYVSELNRAAAPLARSAADAIGESSGRPRFVAGCSRPHQQDRLVVP